MKCNKEIEERVISTTATLDCEKYHCIVRVNRNKVHVTINWNETILQYKKYLEPFFIHLIYIFIAGFFKEVIEWNIPKNTNFLMLQDNE